MQLKSFTNWIPPLWRVEYKLKFALSHVGLFDKKAVYTGLKHVFDDDIFIVSYPKSGNTWVRFIIANLISDRDTVSFRNINNYVPDIYLYKDYLNTMKQRPRFIKTHDAGYEFYPKFIYIYRDGRDVAISYYHYLTGRGEFNGTLKEFLNSKPSWGAVGWSSHVSRAIDYAKSHSDQVLLVKYEDLLNNTVKNVKRIADFCQLNVSIENINFAINKSEFHRLKKIEKQYGSEFNHSKNTFFRSGNSGQWKEMFSEEDIQQYLSIADNTLRQLGYLD
ncbi:sulfotransferase domain protein [Lyngbya aestuarii BL J]|uniref:Sulfotransferase domain protein n=1 Tax=Lyngbya aestuarii BL J TaxID=1348334 RepID=U7QM78_9CYAN|nr:sulfotransferase domain-containing protein [Lyngbya aestuarii]ERT08225.1 sulfotransferase domain protein [Lyngbya aestuarii BL J]